jgi:hypothetical protein
MTARWHKSFDPRLSRLLKTNMLEVGRGLVVRDGLPPMKRRMAMWLADPQFIAVERTALWKAMGRAREDVCQFIWTVRQPISAQAEVQADALIWEADGRPRN